MPGITPKPIATTRKIIATHSFINILEPNNVKMTNDVKWFMSKWQDYIYPQSYTPAFQILGGFMMGLAFGPYHKSFIMTIVSYMIFELILVIATQGRVPAIYDWKIRIAAIGFGIIGLLISKYLWLR